MGANHVVGAPSSRSYWWWLWWVLWLPAAAADLHGRHLNDVAVVREAAKTQERRASKMKVAARIHQVIITILHRALAALGQRLWPRRHTIPRQNVTTIQRTPQIYFSKNREKRMAPFDFPFDTTNRKSNGAKRSGAGFRNGAPPHLAVFSPLLAPFGKCTI